MKIELEKWSEDNKSSLIRVCKVVDRRFLSNRSPYPYTESDADWWLNKTKEEDGVKGIYRAVIVDGKIVGNISVEKKTDVRMRDAEIGYMLMPQESSKGIMTTAVEQICNIAFEELDIIRITGLVYAPNSASRKVLEKNGFTQEGNLKNAVCKDGQVYDLCVYGKCIG